MLLHSSLIIPLGSVSCKNALKDERQPTTIYLRKIGSLFDTQLATLMYKLATMSTSWHSERICCLDQDLKIHITPPEKICVVCMSHQTHSWKKRGKVFLRACTIIYFGLFYHNEPLHRKVNEHTTHHTPCVYHVQEVILIIALVFFSFSIVSCRSVNLNWRIKLTGQGLVDV